MRSGAGDSSIARKQAVRARQGPDPRDLVLAHPGRDESGEAALAVGHADRTVRGRDRVAGRVDQHVQAPARRGLGRHGEEDVGHGTQPVLGHPPTLRQDQVDVAELVPEVAARRGSPAYARLEQRAAGDGLEHAQVGGLRLVPAGEQAVDRVHAALGRDDERRSSRRGVHAPSASVTVSSARTTVVPTATTRRRRRGRRSTAAAVDAGTREPLRVRRSSASSEADAACAARRGDADAVADEAVEHLGR